MEYDNNTHKNNRQLDHTEHLALTTEFPRPYSTVQPAPLNAENFGMPDLPAYPFPPTIINLISSQNKECCVGNLSKL